MDKIITVLDNVPDKKIKLQVDNLKLWNSVEKTDPSHTKRAKKGSIHITAIDPQYQRKNATQIFGPYGIGWGVTDEDYFMSTHGDTTLCRYTAKMWYMYEGKAGELPIHGVIKVSYITQGNNPYLYVDDEYAKKVATDALTKGLSTLGFNADVFLGKFDDNKYVNDLKQEFNTSGSQKSVNSVNKDNGKKWLNESDVKEWENAERKVSMGLIEPKDLRNYYNISKANMDHFERIKQESIDGTPFK